MALHLKSKAIILFILPLTISNCSPQYHLSAPEEAWMSEKLPKDKEYVMVEYNVKLVNCALKVLVQGESGIRWKIIVKFKNGDKKQFWAYKIANKTMTDVKLYAPIKMTMEELMQNEARIFLVSHDQRKLFAYAYTINGQEFPKQADQDDFDWSNADIIMPSGHIKSIHPDSNQDHKYKEAINSQIISEIEKMNPTQRRKIAKYIKEKQMGQAYLGIKKALEVISQYFAGYLYSGDWLKPLYSLSIFQSVWLLNFLIKPDNPESPEYFGAKMTQRRFAKILTAFHDSLMLYMIRIQKHQKQMQKKLIDEIVELRAEMAELKIIAEQALRMAEFNNNKLQSQK